MKTTKILLILTGGTICSFANQRGEQASDTNRARTLIVENFRNGNSPFCSEKAVEFTAVSPLDVLSENMTVCHWNTLIQAMRSYDYSAYDGVIILHGTDTLAYTASLLSMLLSGLPIPVIMVSSQLAVYDPRANGNANFRAAVELIVNKTAPNVYAVYRNEEPCGETMYIHYASRLLQCANHSDNFYSSTMTPISMENAVFDGTKSSGTPLIYDSRLNNLSARILKIQPYVGLDYSSFCLKGISAILHGTYHSSTMATDPLSVNSIMYLKEICQNQEPPVPLFIEPYIRTTYESTGDALRGGILPIEGLTSETAYAKTLIGCSMGMTDEELYSFIKNDINNEHIM